MKLLYVLFFVFGFEVVLSEKLSDNYKVEVVSDDVSRNIGRPQIYYSITYGPPFRGEFWFSLVPSPPLDPVRGYRVQAWEQQKRIVYVEEMIDGVLTLVPKEELAPFPSDGVVPDWNPRDLITLPGSASNFFEIKNMEIGIWYEMRVQAFTWNEFGPMSLMYRIRFNES